MGVAASKSCAKDPVRFSALLGGPGMRVALFFRYLHELATAYPRCSLASSIKYCFFFRR